MLEQRGQAVWKKQIYECRRRGVASVVTGGSTASEQLPFFLRHVQPVSPVRPASRVCKSNRDLPLLFENTELSGNSIFRNGACTRTSHCSGIPSVLSPSVAVVSTGFALKGSCEKSVATFAMICLTLSLCSGHTYVAVDCRILVESVNSPRWRLVWTITR